MQMRLPFSDAHLAVEVRRPKPRRPRPAAGLLLRYVDHDGAWFLLGKRCRSLGGTWANIGGSLEPDEHPLMGAMREFTEELGLKPQTLKGATIARVLEAGSPDVPYTLFVLDVPHYFDNARLSWEHDDLCWFLADEVSRLDLHPAFRAEWDAMLARSA
jgi:8-oxo-dGTP pyrophosphatase MutT (NUDIX family)